MDAILATIVNGGRAIILKLERQYNFFFSFSLLILIKPINDGLVQPLPRRLPGVGYARPTKPCRWRGKRLHHDGDVCVLVFN